MTTTDAARPDALQPRADRPRGRQRHARDLLADRPRGARRAATRVEDDCARRVHVGLHQGRAPEARQALREGQGRPVERAHRPALGDRGRPGAARLRDLPRGRAGHASGIPTSPAPRSRSGARRSGSQFNVENQNWTLSQFMHGEQGALLCTAKIVETVPWIDAKYYAATQVDRRGAPRRGLQPLPATRSARATTR